ncbi:MAG: acyl-CoA reductase [Roseateles sp.]|uniref:acyl-CoA reductase n=1 Tax=Roseateles sp. TaxID=1971397 RepID=UPI0039EB1E1E
MSIRYILGAQGGAPIAQVLASLRSQPAWRPFDERAVAFVRRFSQKLLTSAGIRQHPELAALGHWFRGANLQTLAGKYELDTPKQLKLGRGLAFHLAPSNVDSVFMYSWLLSLLAGNVNLVRVSQKGSAPQDFLVGALAQTLAEDVGAPVRERIVLLTYPHDDQLTRTISESCLIRVVWGGDATVRALRAIPLRPTATEICFPDRFSACAIRASAVLEADDAALAQLAMAFYNDAFWFAQQACSSPRLVAWVGDDASVDAAAERFWAALETELARRQPENSEAMNMARVAASFEYAAARLARPAVPGEFRNAHPMRLRMEAALDETAKTIHCGNGLFLETRLPRLTALAPQLSDKEQTLAVHGFPREELVELALALPARAVDRFAKFGEALSFAPIWDGQDLILSFSRNVLLPSN